MSIPMPVPAAYLFRTEIPVQIQDINYGNHLGHDRLVSFLHEARVRFLTAHGLSELDAGGAGMLVAELAVNYLAEAFHGDTLILDLAFMNPSRIRCDMVYRVSRDSDRTEIATARVGLVFYDYAKAKPAALPDAFRRAAGLDDPGEIQ